MRNSLFQETDGDNTWNVDGRAHRPDFVAHWTTIGLLVTMKVSSIEWDDSNRAHVAAHLERGLSEQAVEEVLLGRCARPRAVDPPCSTRERRRIVFGRTCEGRYLKVIVGPRTGAILRPVTAWPMSEREIETYEAWRRTVKR